MAAADYRLMTEATGQRIAAALESLVNLGDPVTIAHGGTGASTAAAALTALGGVAVTDIVDNLTSTATDKPLAAAQGKALNDKFTWQTGESTTDKTAIKNVPSTANEAIIEIQYRTNLFFSFTLNKIQLSTATRHYYDTGIRFASSGAACRLDVLNYTIKVDTLYIDGGTEDFKMQIYYR